MQYSQLAFLAALAGSTFAAPAGLEARQGFHQIHATDGAGTAPTSTAASNVAPTDHPDAIKNEFKYVNFDRSDEGQAKDMNLLHYAFAGLDKGDNWQSLIGAALKVIGDTGDDTFLNWFPDKVTKANNMDARAYVGGVFRRLYTPGTVQDRVKDIVADHNDFGSSTKCDSDSDDPKIKAYMQRDTGHFHVCPLGLNQPMVPSKDNCSSLGDKVSKGMRSLSSTMLHEMLHWNEIGDKAPSSIGHITDVRGAYDPGVCYGMAHAKSDENRQKAFINDNNYMYLALNAYYNDVCGKKFDKPDLPSAIDEGQDEAECDAQKDECDGDDGVNLGTYGN